MPAKFTTLYERNTAKMRAEWRVQTLTADASRNLDRLFADWMEKIRENMSADLLKAWITITTSGPADNNSLYE